MRLHLLRWPSQRCHTIAGKMNETQSTEKFFIISVKKGTHKPPNTETTNLPMSSMSNEDSANCPFEVIKFPNKTLAMKLGVSIFESGNLVVKALQTT